MWKRYVKVAIVLMCVIFLFVVGTKQEQVKTVQQNSISQKKKVDKLIDTTLDETVVGKNFVLEYNPLVRVVISDSDWSGIVHKNVLVTSGQAYELLGPQGQLYAEYEAGQTIDFSDYNLKKGESLIVSSPTAERFSIDSLTRAQGVPFFRGKLQIYKEDNGFVVVNELPLEEYLLTVVPSEMPSNYPADALAAQAVCARSYAYSFLYEPGYPQYEAHMDDSTAYQVYNNIEETESTTAAVVSTRGTVLLKDDKPTSTFFFSTSCGVTSNENVWSLKNEHDIVTFAPVRVTKTPEDAVEAMAMENGVSQFSAEDLCDNDVFASYIETQNLNDLEVSEQWYRWTYEGNLTAESLYSKMCDAYEEKESAVLTLYKGKYVSKSLQEFNKIKNIYVQKRLPGGVADEVIVVTDKDTYLLKSEYYIRKILADRNGSVTRNDGTKVSAMNLLPSAYFALEMKKNKSGDVSGVILKGGGYGHGVGMSQNGAKCAALEGMSWQGILSFFYGNLELVKAENQEGY